MCAHVHRPRQGAVLLMARADRHSGGGRSLGVVQELESQDPERGTIPFRCDMTVDGMRGRGDPDGRLRTGELGDGAGGAVPCAIAGVPGGLLLCIPLRPRVLRFMRCRMGGSRSAFPRVGADREDVAGGVAGRHSRGPMHPGVACAMPPMEEALPEGRTPREQEEKKDEHHRPLLPARPHPGPHGWTRGSCAPFPASVGSGVEGRGVIAGWGRGFKLGRPWTDGSCRE